MYCINVLYYRLLLQSLSFWLWLFSHYFTFILRICKLWAYQDHLTAFKLQADEIIMVAAFNFDCRLIQMFSEQSDLICHAISDVYELRRWVVKCLAFVQLPFKIYILVIPCVNSKQFLGLFEDRAADLS